MSVGEISTICQEPGKVFNEMKLNLFRILVLIYFFSIGDRRSLFKFSSF